MTILKIVFGLILGSISGSLFLSILIFLFIRIPFLKRLDSLGQLLNKLPFNACFIASFAFFISIATTFVIATFFESLVYYFIGFVIIIFLNLGKLYLGMLHSQVSKKFSQDFARFLLPGWERITAKRQTTCLNYNCQSLIPDSAMGVDSGRSYPKCGEFGFCSDKCFNEFYD
jgi:hypothetical protein